MRMMDWHPIGPAAFAASVKRVSRHLDSLLPCFHLRRLLSFHKTHSCSRPTFCPRSERERLDAMSSLIASPLSLRTLLLSLSLSASLAAATNPYVCYANDFVDPAYTVSNANNYASSLSGAQQTIVAWAEELNSHGPWSVTDKPVLAPSGDKHDYMSWAPYSWPDCSSVHNTTALSAAEIRKTCPYVTRDGDVNPDRDIPDDFQSFFNLSDAVLYNTIASTFSTSSASTYQANAVKFIQTWFIDNSTFMNPELTYAQMELGPTGQLGTFTGVLDLRGMVKIVSGILMLRQMKASAWTSDLDNAMVAWAKKYITWLQTASTAKQAAAATNNHGTFYAGQLTALQILVGDNSGANATARGYFGGIFNGQIAANGDQPLEATRTRPYHYRNFNIAGMVTAARLLKYVDPSSNVWNSSSKAPGATIQKAVDFVMTVNPAKDADPGDESYADVVAEIYPNIAAIASTYGDPTGSYVNFLVNSGFPYTDDAFFLWDQPLASGSSSGSGGAASSSVYAAPSATGPRGAAGTATGAAVGYGTAPAGGSSGTAANAGAGSNSNSGSAAAGAGAAQGTSAADSAGSSAQGSGSGGSLGGLSGAARTTARPSASLWWTTVLLFAGLLSWRTL
ncbi:Chondroitin AC/alginate lyase [Mycena chlorophos]|uniref:Chondroitin AC/alginate lyase n=1 Tax=Mycena chlorophos TaxID=658473 RepID=A0A8H6SVK2_MYCCL|nr:Chondroitin AC/alginate lyase [Mycena chlorophos]